VSERPIENGSLVELLMDAEVLAWLEDYRPPRPDEGEDDDTPAAA
jgi:hypothetical protein